MTADPSDGSDDNNSVVSGQWQPDAADVEMVSGLSLIEALPMGRMRVDSSRVVRRAKRMKLDLETTSASLVGTSTDGMFAELNLIPSEAHPDEHTGGALLCFLSQATALLGAVCLSTHSLKPSVHTMGASHPSLSIPHQPRPQPNPS